jgi:purine nucleosidase
MESSYAELETIARLMGINAEGLLYRGMTHALPSRGEPVDSQGAQLIIREAMKDDPAPLFVTFLGPLTDLASALLLEPRIDSRLILEDLFCKLALFAQRHKSDS